MDDAKREKREILGQIEDIKSALSDTYSMQQDARRREEANRELKRQVQLLEARLEKSKRDKEHLVVAEHELRKTTSESQKLAKQKEKLLRSVDSLKSDVREMKKQLDTATSKADKAGRHEISLADRLKDLEHQRDMFITDKQDIVEEMTMLRKNYEEARNDLTKVRRDYTNIEGGLARCNQSRERLIEESDQVKSELRKVRDHVAQLEGQKTAIEEELYSIQKEKQGFEKTKLAKEALERDLKTSRANLKKLEEEHAGQEGTVRDLHGEISHLKKEIEIGKESIREYDSKVSDLSAQTEKLQVRVAEVEVEREVYQRQVTDLEKQVTEETDARKEYEHSAADEIEILHQKMTEADLRAAETEETKETLSAQVKSLERIIEDRTEQVNVLDKELEERGRELSESRRESNEMERLLHERLGETESSLARKTVEAEESSSEKERLLKELVDLRHKFDSTQTDLEEERDTYEQERTDWKNIREELDKTHVMVKGLRDELQELHDEKSELQKQIAKEEFEHKETKAGLDRERSERSELESQLPENRRDLKKANREIKTLRLELDKARDIIPKAAETEKVLSTLDIQVKSLEEERDRLKRELKERDAEIEHLNKDVMASREEVHEAGTEAARKREAEMEAVFAERGTSVGTDNAELDIRVKELEAELDSLAGQAAAREKELIESQATLAGEYEQARAEASELAGRMKEIESGKMAETKVTRSEREKTAVKFANLEAIIAKFDEKDDDTGAAVDYGAGIVQRLARLPVDEVFFEHLAMFFEPGQPFPQLGIETISSIITSLRDSVDSNSLETLNGRPFGNPALHAYRVAALSIMLAEFHGLPGNKVIEVGEAALLHDIGIQAVEPGGLYGKYLSPGDMAAYREHPSRSAEAAEQIGTFTEDILRGIREHHENVNGTGFPNGLLSGDIHEYAKIISIIDRFDRLVHPSPGIEPLLPAMAIKELLLAIENHEVDNMLMRSFLSCVGLFPIGSFAKLKSGEIARIVGANASDPKRPTIVILQDARGSVLNDPRHVNLASAPEYAISGPVWCEHA